MKERIPNVSDQDIERIVARDFGASKFGVVMESLSRYESGSRAGMNRVRSAILRLASGKLAKLSVLVETAIADYRDVIVAAETPAYFRGSSEKLSDSEKQSLLLADWSNYQEWFVSTASRENHEIESHVDAMASKEAKLFVIEFNKASQIDRSLSQSGMLGQEKARFRQRLVDCCIRLMCLVDTDALTNSTIRKEILALAAETRGASFGQVQKVINVCLKQYCFLSKKRSLLKELDCPLDTTTMKGRGIKNNRMISVTWDDYVKYQGVFEREYGIRILADEQYDSRRIDKFFMLR